VKVAGLHIYPVKSCAGVPLQNATVKVRGLAGDRRAMIIDGNNRFITLRSHNKLAKIKPAIQEDRLRLDINGQSIEPHASDKRTNCVVWKSTVDAVIADPDTNTMISDFLDQSVRLVFMDDQSQRSSNPEWAQSDVSFADGYPYLITNTASLNDLNNYLPDPITMARFRPNIVLDHLIPWAEDGWKTIKIGNVIFDLVKPCTRCEVTNLDPLTGESRGDDVTRALAKHRRSADKRVKGFLFGWNAVSRGSGIIRQGDPVEILETRDPWPIS